MWLIASSQGFQLPAAAVTAPALRLAPPVMHLRDQVGKVAGAKADSNAFIGGIAATRKDFKARRQRGRTLE
jgi:hypothetical protein